MDQLEKEVEAMLRKRVNNIGGLFYKFVSPGNNGVPDRIAVLPGGKVYFIELKKDGETPRKLQVWQQNRLRRLGCDVRTVEGMDEARQFIEEVSRYANIRKM